MTAADVGVTVTDDDIPSTTITLSVSPQTVREGAGTTSLTVTAELDASPEEADTELTLSLQGGTAQVSDDFEAAVGDVTLTIRARKSSGTAQVTLTPVDDDVDENDETVRITVVNATSGSSLQVDPPSLDVTIEDDDTRGVTVTPTTLTVLEGESTSYAVRLTSWPTGPVTVTPAVTRDTGTRTVTVAPLLADLHGVELARGPDGVAERSQ